MTITNQNPNTLIKYKSIGIYNPFRSLLCTVGPIEHTYRSLFLHAERNCHEVTLSPLVDGGVRGLNDDGNFFSVCRLARYRKHLVQKTLEILPE